MLTLRSARQSALRLSRCTTAAAPPCRCWIEHNHAESSSAPFRRLASSSPPSTSSAVSEAEANPATSTSANGETGRGEQHHQHYHPSSSLSTLSGSRKNAEGPSSTSASANARHKVNLRLRKQALAKAKRLAQAIKDERPIPSSFSPSSSFWTELLAPLNPSSSSSPAPSGDTGYSAFAPAPAPASAPAPSSLSSSNPTIDDLLSKKPSMPPPNPWHHSYPVRHKELYNSLDAAFLANQLRRLGRELNLGHGFRRKATKADLIGMIMDSWGWVKPRKMEVPQTRRQTKTFDLAPPELFLLLRDNGMINRFTQDEGLQLSVLPASETESPLVPPTREDEGRMVLLARGGSEGLERLAEELRQRAHELYTTEMTAKELLGLAAPAGLLQAVSNAAGAYVEPLQAEKYRITSMSEEAAEHAKRLLAMAALRASFPILVLVFFNLCSSSTPMLTGEFLRQTTQLSSSRSIQVVLPLTHFHPSTTNKFALFPFTPSLTEPLPWDLSATSPSSFFRLKKVGQWTSKPARREVEHRQEEMADAPVRLISGSNARAVSDGRGQGEHVETLGTALEQLLRSEGGGGEGTTKVTATFGHVLVPAPTPAEKDSNGNSKGSGGASLLDSPLPGQWPVEMIERVIRPSAAPPNFAPCLTPAMIQFPLLDSAVQRSRRIRYRSVPKIGEGQTTVLSFTCTRPSIPVTMPEESEEAGNGTATEEKRWQDQLGDFLAEMEKDMEEEKEQTELEKEKKDELLSRSEEDQAISSSSSSSMQRAVVGDGDGYGANGHVEEQYQEQAQEQEEASVPVTDPEERGEIKNGMNAELVAELGVVREVDLLLPDRPIDARIATTTSPTPLASSDIPPSISAILEAYAQGRSDSNSSPPPRRITLNNEQYHLESDEEVEAVEQESEGVKMRSVRVFEQGVFGRPLAYTELECTVEAGQPMVQGFWKELASVTRDVGPDAAALRQGNVYV